MGEDGGARDPLVHASLTPAPTRYTDPRAHELRAEYLATFPADEIPVPVESIAEDLLGLRIEERDLGDCSGMLIPSERPIVLNAAEATNGDVPARRHRFTIAHELGHWICHAQQDVGEEMGENEVGWRLEARPRVVQT
jgi:hypothetical protein